MINLYSKTELLKRNLSLVLHNNVQHTLIDQVLIMFIFNMDKLFSEISKLGKKNGLILMFQIIKIYQKVMKEYTPHFNVFTINVTLKMGNR